MVQEARSGRQAADEAAAAGLKVETASGFRRDASLPGVPAGAIAAAFRTAKDGVGQTAIAGANEWIVLRVTDVSVPPVDMASDDIKKLKETLQRGLTHEHASANTSPSLNPTLARPINRAVPSQAVHR